MYRLKNESEIFNLDYELALDDIILMEWPDRIKNYLPDDRIEIIFNEDKNYNKYMNIPIKGTCPLCRKEQSSIIFGEDPKCCTIL